MPCGENDSALFSTFELMKRSYRRPTITSLKPKVYAVRLFLGRVYYNIFKPAGMQRNKLVKPDKSSL
jgi:hypothetical protein